MTVEIAVEFRRVQQALQYSVTVEQEPRVVQSFGLVYTVGTFSGTHERPAFVDATVDATSKISNSAHCRHGCIGLGSLVEFVVSGYSSKDQLCRLVLICGSIDGCVVVCKSRTCGQQSMLSVQEEKISASKTEKKVEGKDVGEEEESRRQRDLWRA